MRMLMLIDVASTNDRRERLSSNDAAAGDDILCRRLVILPVAGREQCWTTTLPGTIRILR